MNNQVVRVLCRLAEKVGTPRALAVKLLAQNGEWTQLQQLRCESHRYRDAESYWKDNLVTEFLRKCDLPTDVDKEAAAKATFLECERQCAATNARLARYLPHRLLIEPEDLPVYDFINRWRKEVKNVLGNLPMDLTPRFSSGATYADTGLYITTPDKMSSIPTIYSSSECLLPLWGETAWSRALVKERPWQSRPRVERGNIFFCVPKDGTKFRGCCKEASIPISYQLDVGRVMKTRLPRIGIELRDGKDRHMMLAQRASVRGDTATLDQSNASDTVARVLVQLLLPADWYELLDSLRATHTRMDGRWYRLEKFSSMGNGFTFELETILFATLARTVVASEGGDPDLVWCYGDDLIVPAAHALSVMSALRMFGFTPNMKKTFIEGPFRESCGGDYFDGTPVRAHYVERLPDEPQHWISLANGLRRVALADCGNIPRWDVVRSAWLLCLELIPSDIRRCRGPSHLEDVVIHDDPSRWCWAGPPGSVRRGSWDNSWEQDWLLAYLPVPSVLPWKHWSPAVQLASCTIGLPSAGITPRGGVSGFRIGRVPARVTSSWLPTTTAGKR